MSRPESWLKRGFGEFLVVLFGVAVALAAENWREGQADRVLERQYLDRLLTELEEGRPTVAQWSARLDSARSSVDSLLAWMRQSSPRDSSAVPRLVVVSTAARFNAAGVILDLTYRELIGTGSLNLIRDPVVRDRITQYDRLAYRAADAFDEVRVGAYLDWPEAVMGAVGRSPGLAAQDLQSLGRDETARILALLSEPGWPDQMRTFKARNEVVKFWLDRLLEGTDEVIQLLETAAAGGESDGQATVSG